MREDLLEKYPSFFEQIVTEMAITFGGDSKKYVPGLAKVKKAEVAADREKTTIYRYGVQLTQEGENYVYISIKKIQRLFRDEEGMDNYDSERTAKDLMCVFLLERVFKLARLPFESNYDKQMVKRKRTFNIKMMGFITFVILVLVVIISYIIKLF
ncbi:MAG: hypothetical protein ACOX0I_02455 [Bacilli bacterium]